MKLLAISAVCIALVGCGGGGGGSTTSSVTAAADDVFRFPAVTLNNTLPRVEIASMPLGYHEYSELHFTMTSNGYFKENPTGHAAMVMRSSIPLFATAVRGQGLVFGDVSGATNTIPGNPATEPNPLKPSTQIETWFNDLTNETGNHLLAAPKLAPVMEDYVPYDFMIQTHNLQDKSVQTIRYTITVKGTQIYDSGVVNDPNKYLDTTLNDIYAGHVFDNPTANPWTLTFSNISLYY